MKFKDYDIMDIAAMCTTLIGAYACAIGCYYCPFLLFKPVLAGLSIYAAALTIYILRNPIGRL